MYDLEQPLETASGERGISRRAGDALVAQVVLNEPRVAPIIRQLITGAVPQHMGVWLQFAEASNFARTFDHAVEASRCERAAALGSEYPLALRFLFPLEPAECPQFIAVDRMRASNASLSTADVKRGTVEVHVCPLQVAQFRRAQAVLVAQQDHSRVAVPPSVLGRCGSQALNFLGRQILARPVFAVHSAPRRFDCSLFCGWRHQLELRFCHGNSSLLIGKCSYTSRNTNSLPRENCINVAVVIASLAIARHVIASVDRAPIIVALAVNGAVNARADRSPDVACVVIVLSWPFGIVDTFRAISAVRKHGGGGGAPPARGSIRFAASVNMPRRKFHNQVGL